MANGYKKISSSAFSSRVSTTTLSLWHAADHLLQVERDHYMEKYRRFYFSDIEVFTVRLDNRRRNIAITFGILVAAALAMALYFNGGFASGFFFSVAGFFMIPFIYNLVRGPTCAVHIATAVQREELGSVRRVKGAMRLLRIIADGAARTQGELAPDMVRVKFELQKAPPPMPGTPPIAAVEPGVMTGEVANPNPQDIPPPEPPPAQ
jgi:hypothetical protein